MPSPHDYLGYSTMIHDALRGVVRKTLLQVKEFGMPIDHHFYITFKTMAPQVVLPLYLRQKYPESMTIVLQYQFYNLIVTESTFSASLSFGGKFETLTVPFSAIVMFSDPEAQLVFNFEPAAETLPPPSALADKEQAEKPSSSIGLKPSAAAKRLAQTPIAQTSIAKAPTKITNKTTTKATTKVTTKVTTWTPTWHGSIALGAQTPFETPQQKTETQSLSQNKAQNKTHNEEQDKAAAKLRNKGGLKQVATQTSAKVLTFRPKASHDDNKPSKTP